MCNRYICKVFNITILLLIGYSSFSCRKMAASEGSVKNGIPNEKSTFPLCLSSMRNRIRNYIDKVRKTNTDVSQSITDRSHNVKIACFPFESVVVEVSINVLEFSNISLLDTLVQSSYNICVLLLHNVLLLTAPSLSSYSITMTPLCFGQINSSRYQMVSIQKYKYS